MNMIEDSLTEQTEPLPPGRRSSPSIWLIVFVILGLAAAGAFGYWKLIYYPTTPRYAIDRFLDAVQAKDYDKVYDMVQVPPAVKVLIRNGRDLKALAEQNRSLLPDIKELVDQFIGILAPMVHDVPVPGPAGEQPPAAWQDGEAASGRGGRRDETSGGAMPG